MGLKRKLEVCQKVLKGKTVLYINDDSVGLHSIKAFNAPIYLDDKGKLKVVGDFIKVNKKHILHRWSVE